MWTYHYNDELYHHGVKGQRWGVRRYQNKDGSLTQAGKRREALRASRKIDEDTPEAILAKKAAVLKSKSAKELYKNKDLFTDDELRKAYERLVMEQNVHKLTSVETSKGAAKIDSAVKMGAKVSDLIGTGTKVVTAGLAAYNLFAKISNAFEKDDAKKLKIVN